MPRKKDTITLSVPAGTKEKLEAIARRFGIMWGKSPSPSGLIAAIALNDLEVGPPFTLNPTQVAAIHQATKLLVDSGYMGEAQTLLGLLLDRGNLELPLRQKILQETSQPQIEAWRALVDRYRQDQQPFLLLYRNAQGQNLEYTVRYGQVSFYEKRFYLDIWCEETQDIQDTSFPELIHNRCLRFDRIQSIIPTQGHWREQGLDYLKVYLHFRGEMVKAYESEDNDISNQVIGEVKQVVKQVSSTFWLVRQIRQYGKNCIIVAPETLREEIRKELRSLCQQYDQK